MFGSQIVNGHRQAISVGGAYAEEIRKWEANFTQFGPPGRPYEYAPFPSMLYKARRPQHGETGEYCRVQIDGADVGNVVWESVTAESEIEAENFGHRGFVMGGKMAALDALVHLEQWVATAAAERAAQDRHMSEKAQAEAARRDDRTIQHLGEIPAEPLPAKGRKVETK